MTRTRRLAAAIAIACAGAPAALAQQTSVTASPDGSLRARTEVPGAPPVEARSGHGRTSAGAGCETPSSADARSGRSVTVRSSDGSSTASAWTSGRNGVVAGGGPAGSHITTTPPDDRACGDEGQGPAARSRLSPPGANR